jgi:capsid portal protein
LDEQREDLVEYLETLNEEDGFIEILTKVWRDYEVTGNGYLEIGRKKNGEIGYMGHIPSTTMRIRRKRDGFVQLSGFDAQFFAHFGAGIDKDTGRVKRISNPLGGGTPNEVIHFKKYSPTSGYYGMPDILAAQASIAGLEFASRYNLDYFENKAVPRYAIILKGATLSQNAEASLLSFFEASLKGQNHRSIYIPLPGDTAESKVDLKLEAIEAGIQDSSFNNYRKANLSDILMAHRVPISKVSTGDGGSLAIARDADKTFKEQVCGPEQ